MAVSMAIGTSLSGIIYNKLGFYGAYGVSSVLLIIGLFYGLLYVKEVAPILETDKKKMSTGTNTNFFNLKNVTQSLNTTFKKRPANQRLQICVLLIILMLLSGTNNGKYCLINKRINISLFFLFTNSVFIYIV